MRISRDAHWKGTRRVCRSAGIVGRGRRIARGVRVDFFQVAALPSGIVEGEQGTQLDQTMNIRKEDVGPQDREIPGVAPKEREWFDHLENIYPGDKRQESHEEADVVGRSINTNIAEIEGTASCMSDGLTRAKRGGDGAAHLVTRHSGLDKGVTKKRIVEECKVGEERQVDGVNAPGLSAPDVEAR